MREALMTLSAELGVIVDFVHELRKKHGITPGSGARGLSSDDAGEVGEFVYHELIVTPDFKGDWDRLENPEFLGKVLAFVEGEQRGLLK